MRSTIRPLLLALVMISVVGSAGGDGWLRSEALDDRLIRGSAGGSVQDATVVIEDEAASIPGSGVLTIVPADGSEFLFTHQCQDFVSIWVNPGRSVLLPDDRPECSTEAAQQVGSVRHPWPSPLTIYVRRGVPVTVVEVDP